MDELNHFDVIYFKEPSKCFPVDYSTLVNELWQGKISDEVDEDKVFHKTIANVNIGLLAKLGSTDLKSIPFKTLKEALHSQEEYGGRLYKFASESVEVREEEDINEEGNVTFRTLSNVKTDDNGETVHIPNL